MSLSSRVIKVNNSLWIVLLQDTYHPIRQSFVTSLMSCNLSHTRENTGNDFILKNVVMSYSLPSWMFCQELFMRIMEFLLFRKNYFLFITEIARHVGYKTGFYIILIHKILFKFHYFSQNRNTSSCKITWRL